MRAETRHGERREALDTFFDSVHVIVSIPEARDMRPHSDTRPQLLFEQVALIQKEDDLRLRKHLQGAESLP